MALFLHDRLFTAKGYENVLLLEVCFSNLAGLLRAGNALNHDFLAAQFHRLIHRFSPDDLAQAHAPCFYLALADIDPFFMELNRRRLFGAVRRPCLGLRNSGWWRRYVVIISYFEFARRINLGLGIITRRLFYFLLDVGQSNGSGTFVHFHPFRRNDVSLAENPSSLDSKVNRLSLAV